MNAPAPPPKDTLSTVLLLTGLVLGAMAIFKLDDIIKDLSDRVAGLEAPGPVAVKTAYEQSIPEDAPSPRPRRPRVVKDTD